MGIYRTQAKEVLGQKVKAFAEKMGVRPAKVECRGNEERWGSCDGLGQINYSWRLMACPEDIIDYVVVHELSHLKEFNHADSFWALVEQFIPFAREKHRQLEITRRALRECNFI
jgi:predicted metal-dependent hydrolase